MNTDYLMGSIPSQGFVISVPPAPGALVPRSAGTGETIPQRSEAVGFGRNGGGPVFEDLFLLLGISGWLMLILLRNTGRQAFRRGPGLACARLTKENAGRGSADGQSPAPDAGDDAPAGTWPSSLTRRARA